MSLRVSTPPASFRAHTPPAPRWGPSEDSYVPFTPRRSSRVAAKRSNMPQTVSPPESPPSPLGGKALSVKHSKRPAANPRSKKTRRTSPVSSDSENEATPFPKAKSRATMMDATGSFLTPAKTPSKKRSPKESLGSASRVLFHGRLEKVEDAMPTPRKSRKHKAFSLNPFFDDMSSQKSDKIAVYEDSKDRVPTADPDDDNPFISKPGARKPAASNPRAVRRTSRDDTMEDAVKKDEGLIYVL